MKIYTPCGLWMLSIMYRCSSVSTISPISISNMWSLYFGARFILACSNNTIRIWVSCAMCSKFKYGWYSTFIKKIVIIFLCLWGCNIRIPINTLKCSPSLRWFYNRDIHGFDYFVCLSDKKKPLDYGSGGIMSTLWL